MQESFFEELRWSTLSVTMNDVAKDNKALVRALRKYDPNVAVPLIASLLTVPNHQSNCLRLELLASLAWRHCNGRERPSIAKAARWFRTIGNSRSTLGEDPAEDVFTSLAIGRNADFRILGGLCESAGFYTQMVHDIVQTMPDMGHWATIKRRVDAILTVSEIVCQNAGLVRHQVGEGTPQKVLSSRHLPGRNALLQRVCIPFQALEERGIQAEDIEPFIVEAEWKRELGNQRASHSILHHKPLVILAPETVTVALPTCLSLAMREYVIREFVDRGLEDRFDRILANGISELLHDTPLLGAFRNVPVGWRNAGQHRVSTLGIQFDQGHFLSLHLFLPSIRTHAKGGFVENFEVDGSLSDELQTDMLASMDNFEREEGFQAGLVLVVGCGWGKGYEIQRFDVDRENWHFESMSIADLVRVSWMADMKPEYFWRFREGLSAIKTQGVRFLNQNGILNLIGWVRRNDGHFVPHALQPSDPITPDCPLKINLHSNMLRDVRAEADSGYDKHGSSDEAGRLHIVQRPSPAPFLESEGSKNLYGSMTDFRADVLTSCYEGKIRLWLGLKTHGFLAKSVKYLLWEMANEWLHRIGTVLETKLAGQFPSTPMRANLEFLDAFVPDGANDKPGRSKLEELCNVQVSQELRCATATFGMGFLDGFRVAENVAERVIVTAMLSGFLQMILRELPVGVLEEFENDVVPNDKARSFHYFPTQRFMDRVRHLLPERLISPNRIDEGIARLGLAWRVQSQSDEPKVEGQRECTAFLNKVVDCLLSDIRQELETLPRRPFLRLVVRNIEKALTERDNWRRTSAAILGLHGNCEETRRICAQQSSKFAAACLASRILAEMGVCMCPTEGNVQPTELSLARLASRILLVERLGGLSNAIKFNVLQPELSISALGDILFKNEFGEMVVEPMLERFLGEQFVQSALNQNQNYEEPTIIHEAKSLIGERFWGVWLAEMEFDIDQARHIIGRIEDMAVARQAITLEMKRSMFIQSVVGDSVDQKAAEAFLDQFCLAHRPRWDRVPNGFALKDIYPWRYGRRLSFVARPIIQIDEGDDPELLVAPQSLREGFAYVLDGAYTGTLEQTFFHTPEMRNVWWGAANPGHEFAASVKEDLSRNGWSVGGNVRLSTILNKKPGMDYGDVDVLAWREDRPEVLIVECKSLQTARNYSEIAAMLSEYQGETKNGKRDKLKRHLDRVNLLSKNQVELGSYIGKNRVKVVSCLCCNGIVPMQYSKIAALEGTLVCTPEELCRQFSNGTRH